ncbi:MAG: hypothetical protein ACE14P_14185 [Methanotrichaceae archaeon]
MNGIEKIKSSLRELLKDREIIARCELLNRIYDFVRNAKLTPEEKDELQRIVGKEIAPGIFASMMSDSPIFFDLPRLDTYTQMNGRIFHFLHTQSYSKQDFDNACRKFLLSLPELRSILRRNLFDLLADFMDGADYKLIERSPSGIKFEAGDRKINAFIFTSIKSVDLRKCKSDAGDDCVILVPSSESLEPFVKFYREQSNDVEASKIQIWIANMEQGTIDPFIGYTTDMDIYKQFKNPRLAEMVRSHWKR